MLIKLIQGIFNVDQEKELSIQQNMNRQQKKKKSVHISQQCSKQPEQVLAELSQVFQEFKVDLGQESSSDKSIESQIDEGPASKSFRSFKKQGISCLYDLNKVLAKELGDQLTVIIRETFQDASDETDTAESIKVLIIFYRLLETTTITEQNSAKMLKWIYQLIELSSYSLSIELCNIISSVKRKFLKLGFLILKKFQKIDCEGIQTNNEEAFKSMVAELIEKKQQEVNQLKYEICRLCERYFPLTTICRHLIECQRLHEIKYHETKIEEKGSQILAFIKNQQTDSSRIQSYFEQLFVTFDGRNALFKHKNSSEAVREILVQYQMDPVPELSDLMTLLTDYNRYRSKQQKGESLSDQDKNTLKSSKLVSIRGVGFSSTSLDPEGQTTLYLSHSEKTINSDNDSHSRGTNLTLIRLKDFEVIRKLGRGSYSEVFLVRKRNTRDLYAMKVIQIEDLNQERMFAFKKEQKIYRSISGSFNVKLYYSFREDNLYFFVLDFGRGGTLRSLLEQQVYFQEKDAKIYLANLVLAVEMLHSIDIIHRDLKPDNIVIDDSGKLILTDFNLCKLIKEKQLQKPNSFYGTPDYIAPQVLRGEPTTEAIDWFSLGVIAYQMIIGVTPFTDMTVQAVFDNILKGEIDWPEIGTEQNQITAECKDFILKLLNPNPHERLGSNGLEEIKAHPFLEGVNWSNIGQYGYYFVPPKNEDQKEDPQLLKEIMARKKKFSSEWISSEQSIVRYDVLKEATNSKAKSRRSSRFKLEKELEDLRLTPQMDKRQQSHNNFKIDYYDSIGVSCHNFHKMDSMDQDL